MVLFHDNIIRTINNDLIPSEDISKNTVETCLNHLQRLSPMAKTKASAAIKEKSIS